MTDFDELRDLADETRAYIQMSDDKAFALRAIVISHDVVLGIYPCAEGMGLHVIKGDEFSARSRTQTRFANTPTPPSQFRTGNRRKRFRRLWLRHIIFPYETMVSPIRKGR